MTRRILVIDDEPSIRLTFEAFLEDEGYAVSSAATVEEALRHLDEEPFDLVFSDILMGDGSGIDVLRRIREVQPYCPVVLVTGFPNVETAAEALRLGAYDYLPKPVTQEILLRVTRLALSFKEMAEEKRRYRANLEAVFRSVREALVTVDPQGRVLELNEAAERICGLGRDAVGKAIDAVSAPCSGACLGSLRQTLAERIPLERRQIDCGHHRRAQIVSLGTTPLLDDRGDFAGAVLVVRDETRLHQLERTLRERSRFEGIVGRSARMQQIYDMLDKLAAFPTTVLVTGESGTGKELIPDALHQRGPRRSAPLVKVNCAALTESLLESELFGYVRGAFTGAVRDGVGRFQKAHGGTIFLDEIGDLSAKLQVKLLRVLQQKVIERVGDSTPICVDVRVVAATNQDLQRKIESGEFREDLFYRLKVVNIQLPPLRERREDIPLLVEHFVGAFNHKMGKEIAGVSQAVLETFMRHDWPGNIRELEHVLEYAFILCSGDVIAPEHLPPDLGAAPKGHSVAAVAGDEEVEALRRALQRAGGNKAKAARLMGVSRRTIYRKMHEYGMEVGGEEDAPEKV